MKNEKLEKKIQMVHLQLTKRCNLNCWFCGQRKKNWDGAVPVGELGTEQWLEVAVQLNDLKVPVKPCVMLWGGEAALSPAFIPVVKMLYENGFSLGMVTNGTLLGKNEELIRKCFKKLYISVDGDRQLHDSIRGKGVFKKIQRNIQNLRVAAQKGESIPEIILMCVLTENSINKLPEILEAFSALHPDEVILQDMISLEETEIIQYKKWFQNCFRAEALEIDAWKGTDGSNEKRAKIGKYCEEYIKTKEFPYRLSYFPHFPAKEKPCCSSPFSHIHIGWNGAVSFCTDFTDFNCGYIQKESLEDIFFSEKAEIFRMEVLSGACITCSHCSWRYKKDYSAL